MKLSILDDDMSSLKRFPPNVEKYLVENRYCFVSKVNLEYFDKTPTNIWGLEKKYTNLIRNLDYRIIKENENNDTNLKEKVNRFLLTIPDLITSVQVDGIIAPLCMSSPGYVHPGNKRIMISRYLSLNYVPVVGRYKDFPKEVEKIQYIKTNEDIYELFGKKISIYFVNNKLEIFYHSSNYRDVNGHDNFTKKAKEKRESNCICSNNIEYLLTNGIEVVHPSFSNTCCYHDGYLIKFVSHPTNYMYINLLDKSLQQEDFWELIFHFDYSTYKKICKSKKIELVNTTVDNKISYSVNIVETLRRRKVYR